ncbi:kelch domain-containing protein 7A [Rhinatrema bivittatum]|uniref:kelch domain-containing protein 7A n=1 Tax=Rhinatrema bivittatum TaxID=194408 RepID=UPI00112BB1F6|nr:kelch domain-containing protein 7A [Rhinatrema bivittatum]
MLHSLGKSWDWQSDMQLAGKLALSAAALLLLTLAYRFYKSRTPTLPQKSGITGEDLGELLEACPAQATPKQDTTDTITSLRYRQITSNGVRQRGNKTDNHTGGHLSGTITRETLGPRNKVYEGDPYLLSKEEEYKTGEAACKRPTNENQTREERQAERIPTKLELVNTATEWFNGQGMHTVGAEENLVNRNSLENRTNNNLDSYNNLQARILEQGNQQGEESNWNLSSKHAEPSPTCSICPKQTASAIKPEISAIDDNRHNPEGEEAIESLILIHDQQDMDRLQTIHARSGIDLEINQTHEKSDGLHVFSSIAEIQVEENYVNEKQPEDDNLTHTLLPGGLKTKVYNYYVSSTSESLSKERSNRFSPSNLCSSLTPSKELLDSESGFNLSQELRKEEDFKEFATAKALTSNVPSHGVYESSKSEALDGMPKRQGSSEALQKQESHRTESVIKSKDNTELQVKTQDFSTFTLDGTNSLSSINTTIQPLYSTQTGSNMKPSLEVTIDKNFFQENMSPDLAMVSQLDLGNCYDMLCTAKKYKLYNLQEAAYKVMSNNYLQILKNSSIYRHLNATERELILERRMKGRKYVTVADVDPQDYNLSASQNSSKLCFYDDENDSWHMLSYIPVEAITRGCAMGTMFNYLFVAAGCEGQDRQNKPSNRVFCYNPLTDNWSEISPLNQARPHCKLVALDGYLYAIGGECLYTVERYDPRQDRWTFTAPMPNDTFVVAHTATACDDEIYVTGGTLRYMMIKYNYKEDSWKINLISGSKDRTTEMVSVNSFIYRFDLNRSMGISVYRCNTRARLWYECAINRIPYPASFQCAVINNKIYCISRQFTLRFLADEVSPMFLDENLKVFPSPKGALFPFVLILPDRDSV